MNVLSPFLPAFAYLVGIFVGALLTVQYYRKYWFKCPVPPQMNHPAAGRFCHICGADAFKNESCNAGLHS